MSTTSAPPQCVALARTGTVRCAACDYSDTYDQFIDGRLFSIHHSDDFDCPGCGLTLDDQPTPSSFDNFPLRFRSTA